MPSLITENKDAGIDARSITNTFRMVDHGGDKLANRKVTRDCRNKSVRDVRDENG
jgi:hypothetical protein